MENELIEDILEDFKTLNGITNGSNDDLFILFIKKSVQSILNLTNRYDFPPELRYVVLDIAQDFYTGENTLTTILNGGADGSIKSISEEGRSVTFGSASESTINSFLSSFVIS